MSPCPAKARRERGDVLEHDVDPDRPSDEVLAGILTAARTIAVVGMSQTDGKAARSIPKILVERGWDVVPVNPNHETIQGMRSYAALAQVPRAVDLVVVFRPAAEAPDLARQAVEIGAGGLWLQAGIRSDEARAIAEPAGLTFVQSACSGALAKRLDLHPASSATSA